ncbi:hypothetical protein [Oryzomicrobium terrae]|nr:hypothetical protein [Oryzomicrobium terrae]
MSEMLNVLHPVVTKDYPENKQGGVMVCGINFGYSEEDKSRDDSGSSLKVEPLSFFSDMAVNKTRFRDRLLTWLSSWGVDLATSSGSEGGLERSFFQTNWLNTQTNSVSSDGVISNDLLVKEAGGILDLMQDRKPKLIILVGSCLIEVLNDIRIRERVELILGERSGNAIIHRVDFPAMQGRKFKVFTQSFGNAKVIGLPHVQSRGLTNEYMARFDGVFKGVWV